MADREEIRRITSELVRAKAMVGSAIADCLIFQWDKNCKEMEQAPQAINMAAARLQTLAKDLERAVEME